HDDRLAPTLEQFVAERAHEDVADPPGAGGGHGLDRTPRIILCLRGSCERDECESKQDFHHRCLARVCFARSTFRILGALPSPPWLARHRPLPRKREREHTELAARSCLHPASSCFTHPLALPKSILPE